MHDWKEYVEKWWSGLKEFRPAWVSDLRERHIIFGLLMKPWLSDANFNGCGFKGELNTPWTSCWDCQPIIVWAPVLRREILPYELVIDIDVDDREKLMKRAKWIKAALETLEIGYILGFSGRRGFHFHVLVDPRTPLPAELPPNFSIKTFKVALLRIILNIAGVDGIDLISTGVFSRHAIREFYSLNERNLAFKLPVHDLETPEVFFPEYPKDYAEWEGYEVWRPSDEQLGEILGEIERMSSEEERAKQIAATLWGRKWRKSSRTLGSRWRVERIAKYLAALEKHGKLIADPEIAQRHENEWLARTHLCFLMIEEGWSDEEILKAFSRAENFSEKETLRQIRGCRRYLEKKRREVPCSS